MTSGDSSLLSLSFLLACSAQQLEQMLARSKAAAAAAAPVPSPAALSEAAAAPTAPAPAAPAPTPAAPGPGAAATAAASTPATGLLPLQPPETMPTEGGELTAEELAALTPGQRRALEIVSKGIPTSLPPLGPPGTGNTDLVVRGALISTWG